MICILWYALYENGSLGIIMCYKQIKIQDSRSQIQIYCHAQNKIIMIRGLRSLNNHTMAMLDYLVYGGEDDCVVVVEVGVGLELGLKLDEAVSQTLLGRPALDTAL